MFWEFGGTGVFWSSQAVCTDVAILDLRGGHVPRWSGTPEVHESPEHQRFMKARASWKFASISVGREQG